MKHYTQQEISASQDMQPMSGHKWCEECAGTGQFTDGRKQWVCPTCKGDGQIPERGTEEGSLK